mgnify:CR=1 FL=1
METTHIMSNPRSGKLGTVNKDDDGADDDAVAYYPIQGESKTFIHLTQSTETGDKHRLNGPLGL